MLLFLIPHLPVAARKSNLESRFSYSIFWTGKYFKKIFCKQYVLSGSEKRLNKHRRRRVKMREWDHKMRKLSGTMSFNLLFLSLMWKDVINKHENLCALMVVTLKTAAVTLNLKSQKSEWNSKYKVKDRPNFCCFGVNNFLTCKLYCWD